MIVLFDIDGTLAHMDGLRTPFEWDKVHADRPDPFVTKLIRMHYGVGDKIIIVSGRDSVCRDMTITWLKENDIPYHALFMRPMQDFRPDTIVKREIWDNHISRMAFPGEVLVYDDRNVVVDMWRELGIKVFQVAYGNF